MTVHQYLDLEAPKFRYIERRHYSGPHAVKEIARTLAAWGLLSADLEQYRDITRVWMWGDEGTLTQTSESLLEYWESERDDRVLFLEGAGRHVGDMGGWIVGNCYVQLDDADREQWILGYIRAAMFAGTVITVDGEGAKVHDDGPDTVDQLGYHYPWDLPSETYREVEIEAEAALEVMGADPVAWVELLDWAWCHTEGVRVSNRNREANWHDLGYLTYLTREGHGTGLWDADGGGLDHAGNTAEGLGGAGFWEFDLDDDGLDYIR